MTSRRWVSSAMGVYRLLLEQQAAGTAGRQLWQAELSLRLRPAADSGCASLAGSAGAQLHTATMLRLRLPAASQALGLLPDVEQRQQRRERWRQQQALLHGSAAGASIHKESSVKSHLTQPPPLQGMAPWDGQVPHMGEPHQQHRPASQAPQYEAADAGARLSWVVGACRCCV